MKLAVHQPHYAPWLGYFAKWAASDLFVFLDTVQYVKNGWQNRNRIKTREGPRWLTVPVRVMPQDGAAGTTTFDTTFQIDRTQFGLNGGGPRSREFKVSIGKNVAIHMAIAARRALERLTN